MLVYDDACETFVSDCNVRTGAELISHAWDPVVLSALRRGPTRRSDLLDTIGDVSDKVLTESLRRLMTRGLVARIGDEPRNSHAVYGLTPLGASFAEGPLATLAEWAAGHRDELASSSSPSVAAR